MRILTVIFCLSFALGQAQDLSLVTPFGVRFVNYFPSNKSAEKMTYSDIKGSCFSNKEWSPAILVLKVGQPIRLKKVKMNFYTNEVQYQDDSGKEFVALNGITMVIMINRNDTTKVGGIFRSLASLRINTTEGFAQVLNEGKTRLIKRNTTSIVKETDPFSHEPQQIFTSLIEYYIGIYSQDAVPLKTLSKASVLSIVKPTPEHEQWLKTNKNKLKSEADIAAYFTFLNKSDQSK